MNPNMWTDMFVLALPWMEKILRPVIVYIALIVGLRLAGKRELAQLNPFDLVVLLTLSNTVQNAIIGNDNTIIGGIIGATTLLLLNYIVVHFVTVNPAIEKAIEGSEDVLIRDGVVQTDLLKHEMITLPELEIAAHKQGFDSLDEIEQAVLEPGGGIAFMGRKPRPEDDNYAEMLSRLDHLTNEIQTLRADLGLRRDPPA